MLREAGVVALEVEALEVEALADMEDMEEEVGEEEDMEEVVGDVDGKVEDGAVDRPLTATN